MATIKPCGSDLSNLVKLQPIEVKIEKRDSDKGLLSRLLPDFDDDETSHRLFSIPVTRDLLEIFPKYIQEAICYNAPTIGEDIYEDIENLSLEEKLSRHDEHFKKFEQSGFYITADIYPRFKELVNDAAKDSFGAFSKKLGTKGKLLEVSNDSIGVTDDELKKMLENPPSVETGKEVDRANWQLLEEPLSETLVAQIRALCKKENIPHDVFLRKKDSSNYYITKNMEVLSQLEDMLNTVKGNMLLNGESNDMIEKFDSKVVYEISKVKGDCEREAEKARTWSIEEIAGTIGLVGILAFGIGAPLGHDIYQFLKRKALDFIFGKRNGPKGPPKGPPLPGGGGGSPLKEAPKDSIGVDFAANWPDALEKKYANNGYFRHAAEALVLATAAAYTLREISTIAISRAEAVASFALSFAAYPTKIGMEEYINKSNTNNLDNL